ncbi:nucleotidyltransferase domain-containing protein [Persephonella sp.]
MNVKPKVRLSTEEIKKIKSVIKKYDPNSKIILFGSRTDLFKKGGDIDLLVISDKIDFRKRRKILVDFQLSLGERKIDWIITDSPEKEEFTKIVYKYGVEI